MKTIIELYEYDKFQLKFTKAFYGYIVVFLILSQSLKKTERSRLL